MYCDGDFGDDDGNENDVDDGVLMIVKTFVLKTLNVNL